MIERLLKCKLCNGNVSSAASRCPHCGTLNFKPDYLVHAETMERNVEFTRRKLINYGLTSAEGYSDEQIRTFFPDCVKITLRVRANLVNTPGCITLAYHSPAALDPPCSDLYVSSWHGADHTRAYIVKKGILHLYLTAEIPVVGKTAGKANRDTREFKIAIDRNSKYIIVETDAHREFLTGRIKLLNPNVFIG